MRMGRTAVKQVSPMLSEKVIVDILAMVAQGIAISKSCKENGIANVHWYQWIDFDPKNQERYARAKQVAADVYADQIAEICDGTPERSDDGCIDPAWVNLQKLRIDSRKWIAAKLKPKKYGESSQIEHTGSLSVSLTPKFADRGDDDGEQ